MLNTFLPLFRKSPSIFNCEVFIFSINITNGLAVKISSQTLSLSWSEMCVIALFPFIISINFCCKRPKMKSHLRRRSLWFSISLIWFHAWNMRFRWLLADDAEVLSKAWEISLNVCIRRRRRFQPSSTSGRVECVHNSHRGGFPCCVTCSRCFGQVSCAIVVLSCWMQMSAALTSTRGCQGIRGSRLHRSRMWKWECQMKLKWSSGEFRCSTLLDGLTQSQQ